MASHAIGALWRGRPARLMCQHRPSPDPSSRRLLTPSSQGQRGWVEPGGLPCVGEPALCASDIRASPPCDAGTTGANPTTPGQQTPLPAGPRTSSTCAALPLSHPFHTTSCRPRPRPTETGEGPRQTALRPGSDAVALSPSLIHHQSWMYAPCPRGIPKASGSVTVSCESPMVPSLLGESPCIASSA